MRRGLDPSHAGRALSHPLRSEARRALRSALARSLGLAVWLSAFELTVRLATSSVRLPDAMTALLDVLAHTGRVAALVPLLIVVDVAISTATSTAQGQRLGELAWSAAALLMKPARTIRIFILTAIAAVVLTKTIGRHYQLAWHAGATYAPLAAVGLAVVELVVSRIRRQPAPTSVHPASFAFVLVALSLFAALVVTVTIDLPGRATRPATAAVVLVLLLCTRVAISRPSGSTPALIAALGVMPCLVALDARRPELRRFDSAVTPFSVFGRSVLTWITDIDGDGVSRLVGADCNDLDPDISPLATDIPDDGKDQNCNGADGVLAASLARYVDGGPLAPVARAGRPTARVSVYFVTVDAWRADVFDDAHFPRTRAWASSCYSFARARATAAFTGPSMVALHMGVFQRHVYGPDDLPTIEPFDPAHGKMSRPPSLAAALASAGYATSVVFPPFFGGDISFLTGYLSGRFPPPSAGAFNPLAETLLDASREAVAEAPAGRPIHFRVHLMDLHQPYRGGGAGKSGYERAARDLDGVLASFLEHVPHDAIVVLTGDHGEAFGEHGYNHHGRTVFDEELRVPLVLCIPERLAAGLGPPHVVTDDVSLVDVSPTIMDLTGVDVPYRRHGTSLVPLLGGARPTRPWVYAENMHLGQKTVVLGCDKWIEDARQGYDALFDVCVDPEERRDIAREQPERAARMRRLLAEIVDLDLDAFRVWRIGSSVVR